VVLFVVQREDCTAFAPAADIDPQFAAALREAAAAGVEVLAWACAMGLERVEIVRPLSVHLAP
jgi:sugar fermentation stimulation protein A